MKAMVPVSLTGFSSELLAWSKAWRSGPVRQHQVMQADTAGP